MEYIYVGMGVIVFLLLAAVGWLRGILYVLIELWRVELAGRYPDPKTGEQIDMAVSIRIGRMVSNRIAKRWYTLTRGEK